MRLATFEKGQKIEAEKRLLAEKALALEQYRQEVFFNAKDPAAQKRVERLRRRWLTLNSDLIRCAKTEQDTVRKELTQLGTRRDEITKLIGQLTQTETELAEKETLLQERETVLNAWALENPQEELHLRMSASTNPDAPAIHQAA